MSNPYFAIDRYVRPIDSPPRFWLNPVTKRITRQIPHRPERPRIREIDDRVALEYGLRKRALNLMLEDNVGLD
jgi:hypothetical protein